jgi:hypothetical protein
MRTTAIGVLLFASTVLLVTSGGFTAVAQPVGGSAAPGTTDPWQWGTDLEAKKEFESSGASRRRVPCDQIISRVDHDPNVQKGNAADMSMVARTLGTSVTWVERCMVAYGRRVKRPGRESAETTERRLESLEENEPEEIGPEDVEEEAEGKPHEQPEKQKRLHNVIRRPTPIGREWPY